MKDGFERREALLQEQKKVSAKINDLDKRLNELKFLYDQYFIGLEKMEPVKMREQIHETIKELTKTYIKSTAQKFKLNSLIAKHSSFTKLWDRITREIEEGKYKRDVFRMKVKDWQATMKKKKGQPDSKDPLSILYDKYVASRQKTNESTNVSREKFSKTIQDQVDQIKKKFKCKSVSFKISIENGKTKLKAVPKK